MDDATIEKARKHLEKLSDDQLSVRFEAHEGEDTWVFHRTKGGFYARLRENQIKNSARHYDHDRIKEIA